MMRYGSVCSGIEAATVAWEPLGWSPVFFSEIEKFPCAVLAHHHGSNLPGEPPIEPGANGVPNLGDMTNFEEWPDEPIDLLVGGTPCQSYSIAGLRKGLADPRGNLMLTFGAIARRFRATWFVWENVPGVLSSNGGRDFGTFLRLMGECGYGFAYRVLDAQYVRVDGFGRAVPQRRRRVFVVGHLRDWRRAAAVLFERESLCGHTAPSRKAGQKTAPTLSARPSGGGVLGTDFEVDGGVISAEVAGAMNTANGKTRPGDTLQCAMTGYQVAYGGNNQSGSIEVATACNAKSASRLDFETETLIAFSAKDSGGDALDDLSPTLRSGGHDKSHSNAGIMPAIAIQERATSENLNAGPDGAGVRDDGTSYTLEARSVPQAVAFSENSRGEVSLTEGDGSVSPPLSTGGGKPGQGMPAVVDWTVRRLMPTECERLQGFPDGYTQIPWRGKPESHCPDGPRYKALGNSMAVNVMRWIGKRIEMVEGMA